MSYGHRGKSKASQHGPFSCGYVSVSHIDSLSHRVRESDHAIDGGLPVEHTDIVAQVVKNGQIVLNNNDIVVFAEKRTDQTSGTQPLLDVQVRGWLIKRVNVLLLDTGCPNGKSLDCS
jgi:hypothetical protein